MFVTRSAFRTSNLFLNKLHFISHSNHISTLKSNAFKKKPEISRQIPNTSHPPSKIK